MATALLEREEERTAVETAIDAGRCDGALLVIGGPAGAGKSSLLALARECAATAGLAVHAARGGELEQEFGFGGVRQLFERPLAGLPATERRPLLRGAAAIAAPLLSLGDAEAPADEFAAIHGLYWLLANLAERRPLLLAVDDAQWLDGPSLRWLAYVARRLRGLPVLLAVGLRDGEGQRRPALAAILAEPDAVVLRPAPLSDAAVGVLAERRLGAPPEPGFAAACHRATGGNPFLVRELLEALAAQGAAPSAAQAERLEDRAPETVSRSVLARLAGLGADATALARAVAVTADGRPLREHARLARLDVDRAERAADALAAADLLEPARPLRFVHPVVRTAIYESLAPGGRSAWHERAAWALVAEGAEPEAVGAQLLRSEPRGRAAAVEQLRAAARAATARGAPEAAVAYLRRALAEAPAASQPPELKRELGRAELGIRDPAAADRLLEAFAEAEGPRRRGEAGLEAADALMFAGRLDESFEVVGRLRVAGTAGPDTIEVGQRGPETVDVNLDARADGGSPDPDVTLVPFYGPSGTTPRVRITGRGGDDTISARGDGAATPVLEPYGLNGLVLRGGPGDDRLIGGRGKDRLAGGPGNDRVEVADRRRGDRVNCGRGRRDRAVIDRADRTRGCELVSIPPR